MTTYEGHCHCGAVQVFFDTEIAPDDVQVRACQCGFCKRRGAKSIGDPKSRIEVRAAPGSLRRYQFGLRTADFLICAECGEYVGAVTRGEDGLVGVLNVTAARLEPFATREGEPLDHEGENVKGRAARRIARWSPAVVVEAQPSA